MRVGFLNGRHYSTYVEELRSLKRAGALESYEGLLLQILDVVEDEARREQWCTAPGYYQMLGILYRQQRRFADEIALLERCRHTDSRHADWVSTRLLKAQKLAAKGNVVP